MAAPRLNPLAPCGAFKRLLALLTAVAGGGVRQAEGS